MCFFKMPSMPRTPTPAPPPPIPQMVAPIEANTEARAAGEDERRRRTAAAGRSDTIMTGGSGLTEGAPTGGKKLLGA